VASMDNEWCTVGSCNCDGLSLLINQEANILIKDQDFAGQLNQAILDGVAESEQILLADYENISWHRKFWYGCAFFIYSALIRFIAVEDFM